MARQLGYRDWNTATAADRDICHIGFGTAVPVLRIHNETIPRGLYLNNLGFVIDWEHRFEPGMPLYARVHRDDAVLDLSEHHGDGILGSVIRLAVGDISALHRELTERHHPRLRPGID